MLCSTKDKSDKLKPFPHSSHFTFVTHIENCHKNGLTNRDKFCLLIDGFWRSSGAARVDNDSITLIKEYCFDGLSFKSYKYISTVNLLIKTINDFMNDRENKCEFSNFDDFNLLNYIYIKGGMLRDIYLLNEINDIDITVDIYSLTRDFKKHLKKYHGNIKNFSPSRALHNHTKCILWRQYLNIFNRDNYDRNKNSHDILTHYFTTKPKAATKIERKKKKKKEVKKDKHKHQDKNSTKQPIPRDLESTQLYFEKYLCHCKYIINTHFIVYRILIKSRQFHAPWHRGDQMRYHPWYNSEGCHFEIRCNKGTIIDMSDSFVGNTNNLNDFKTVYTQYNIHEITDSMDRFLTRTNNAYVKYNNFFGDISDTANNFKNSKNNNNNNNSKIFDLIPLYPYKFSMSVDFYDFTINSIHVNLKYCENSDYWYKNLCSRNNNRWMDTLYNQNKLALAHLKCRKIAAVNRKCIRINNCFFHFWRLIKLCEKFVGSIDIVNENTTGKHRWKIDSSYIKMIEKFYKYWFIRKTMKFKQSKFLKSKNLSVYFANHCNHDFVQNLLNYGVDSNKRNWQSEAIRKYIKKYTLKLIESDNFERWYEQSTNDVKNTKLFEHGLKIYYSIYNNGDYHKKYNQYINRFKLFKLINFDKYFQSKLKDENDSLSVYMEWYIYRNYNNTINRDCSYDYDYGYFRYPHQAFRIIHIAQCFEYFGYYTSNYFYQKRHEQFERYNLSNMQHLYKIHKNNNYNNNINNNNSLLKIQSLILIIRIIEYEIYMKKYADVNERNYQYRRYYLYGYSYENTKPSILVGNINDDNYNNNKNNNNYGKNEESAYGEGRLDSRGININIFKIEHEKKLSIYYDPTKKIYRRRGKSIPNWKQKQTVKKNSRQRKRYKKRYLSSSNQILKYYL